MGWGLLLVVVASVLGQPPGEEVEQHAQEYVYSFTTYDLHVLRIVKEGNSQLFVPYASIENTQSRDSNMASVSVQCGSRTIPNSPIEHLEGAVMNDTRFLTSGPRLAQVDPVMAHTASLFAMSLPKFHAKVHGRSKIDPGSQMRTVKELTITEYVMQLDVKTSAPSPHELDFYQGWLGECHMVPLNDTGPSGSSQHKTPHRFHASKNECKAGDWISSIAYAKKLAFQSQRFTTGKAEYQPEPIALLEIDQPRIPRAFRHDISSAMKVDLSDHSEAFSLMMCKNDMVTSIRNHRVKRDISSAAQGWLPSFLISAIKPLGKAIVSVLFKIVPVMPYIVKGMLEALVDLMLFEIVNALSNVFLGPEMGMIESAMVQEIVFGVVPVLSYMITGHFTIRITKGAIPDIAQALSEYLRKEAMPTVASASSHSITNFISEALTIQLPRKITKALTFTLSHSLTHVVPKYYYCQYCMEKNEYCGYCYGYWRSGRADRAWWKLPEGFVANDSGARTLKFGNKDLDTAVVCFDAMHDKRKLGRFVPRVSFNIILVLAWGSAASAYVRERSERTRGRVPHAPSAAAQAQTAAISADVVTFGESIRHNTITAIPTQDQSQNPLHARRKNGKLT